MEQKGSHETSRKFAVLETPGNVFASINIFRVVRMGGEFPLLEKRADWDQIVLEKAFRGFQVTGWSTLGPLAPRQGFSHEVGCSECMAVAWGKLPPSWAVGPRALEELAPPTAIRFLQVGRCPAKRLRALPSPGRPGFPEELQPHPHPAPGPCSFWERGNCCVSPSGCPRSRDPGLALMPQRMSSDPT